MSPAVRARGLAVDLGGRAVLRDVDLEVCRGERLALLGPNGAGKTTLLRALLGLVRLRAGSVEVAPGIGRTLGYVPQRHEFAWELPVPVHEAALSGRVGLRAWWRRPGVDDHRAAREALERVDLADLADRPVGDLSGGQRQRVLVARALALGSPVLLLDEPFTGLDLPTQELLIDLLARLAADGVAVVMSTHDIASALVASERLALVAGGVRAVGRPDELRDPHLWAATFGVGVDSPFLRGLGLIDSRAREPEGALR